MPDTGYHIRHHAMELFLFRSQVKEELAVECRAVSEETCCGHEHLCVRSPAHTLVPLRAVRGHVQEIPLLSPADVGDQLIDLPVPGGKPPGFHDV